MAASWHRGLAAPFSVLCLLAPHRAGAGQRVVAVADLHGDYAHATALLRAAGLAEEGADVGLRAPDGHPFTRYRGVRWVGGNATLVQTGDMVDRGAYAHDLYALFAELRHQAAAAGGQVVNLIGNHDLMNLQGDLRYVTGEDEAEFGGAAARRSAFAPAGWVGRQILAEFHAAFLAGDTLFVHAGLLPEHLEQGLDGLNAEFRRQLQASLTSWLGKEGALLKATGPLWLRRLAKTPEAGVCPQLARVLELAGAKRMVIGHTQVDEGAVRPRCGGRLLLADTIISREGYPECWQPNSMKAEGCQGSLSYVEVQDGEAAAVRVPPPGDAEGAAPEAEVTPMPILAGVERGEL